MQFTGNIQELILQQLQAINSKLETHDQVLNNLVTGMGRTVKNTVSRTQMLKELAAKAKAGKSFTAKDYEQMARLFDTKKIPFINFLRFGAIAN